MGLGTRKIKTEMTGTGGGRWMRRAEAKSISKKARRTEDRRQSNNSPTDPAPQQSPSKPPTAGD